jgi:hypothetical protein
MLAIERNLTIAPAGNDLVGSLGYLARFFAANEPPGRGNKPLLAGDRRQPWPLTHNISYYVMVATWTRDRPDNLVALDGCSLNCLAHCPSPLARCLAIIVFVHREASQPAGGGL